MKDNKAHSFSCKISWILSNANRCVTTTPVKIQKNCIPQKVPSHCHFVINPGPHSQPLADTDLFYLSWVLSFLGCYLIFIFWSAVSFLLLNLDGKNYLVFMPKPHQIIMDCGELWMCISKNNYFQVFIDMHFRGLTHYEFFASIFMMMSGHCVRRLYSYYVLILEKGALLSLWHLYSLQLID